MYDCRRRRVYRSGVQILDRIDPTGTGICISGENLCDQCTVIFCDRSYSSAGSKGQLAGSADCSVSESRDMRRFYDIFLFCIGNGGYVEKRQRSYSSFVCIPKYGNRCGCRICRSMGCKLYEIIKSENKIVFFL